MESSSSCPSCGSNNIRSFYKVDSVPVHSCLLMDHAHEAADFPLGDVNLEVCHDCGFIFNTAYQIEYRDYSPIYEDQQSFSATFNKFAQYLAERWINKYNLRNKHIIEIGCGKGDFLILICQLGRNQGLGIDPAVRVDRIDSGSVENVRFLKEYYSEKHGDYKADMICCRHTLEHIDKTAEFVRNIRKSIMNESETLVFFEIPETRRVLREQAFWDVYYEHCSYFTPGSLARLFRREGFEVLDLYTEYDDQYLIIECKPANGNTSKPHPLEEDVADVLNDVDLFEKGIGEKLRFWKDFFADNSSHGKRIAIWGSGSKCVAFMTTLGLNDQVGRIVDINPHRQGKFLPAIAKEIVAPETLKSYNPDIVVVMNPVYRQEITEQLSSMGLNPMVTAV